MPYKRACMMLAAAALVVTGCTSIGQAQPREAVPSQPDQPICSYAFQSGTGNMRISYCVNANGNVLNLETPSGHQHLFQSEGYGLCNESPAVAYWDYLFAGNGGNFLDPVLVNVTNKSVKISRTTADGFWTLSQTLTIQPATPGVKVVMALKNNTSSPRVAYLLRYADPSADSLVQNDFSATVASTFAWNPSIPFVSAVGYGLRLQNVGTPQFGYLQGFARFIPTGPNPCDFAANSSNDTLIGIDGSIALVYADTVGANQTKTATMIYKGL